MKRFAILILLSVCIFAVTRPPMRADTYDGQSLYVPGGDPGINATLIAACGDIRAILGPQGNNIGVCQHGDGIAVIYGAATGNSTNPMAIKIGYSVNQGATWTTFGPFTGNLLRVYGGTDGTPLFCANAGECVFCYQKAPSGYPVFPEEVIIEENLPSAPSPSAPINVTWSDSLFPWQTGITIAPDNPTICMTHAWSKLSGGDNHHYSWTSTDGGYTWNMPVDMGPVNAAYGGNSGVKLDLGLNGYVCGVFNDAVGGITNDGWPHFIESTNYGATWSTPIELPVPHFDSAAGQFWWHEVNAQVINGKPWLLSNDIGGGGYWLWKGTGSPGAWTWTTWDMGVVGACSTWVADTLFQMIPGQYGSICHDPVSGMILVTYKGVAFIVQGGSNVLSNGPAVIGAYTFDEGATWKVARPMSVWNTMTYGDWNGTETAHRLVNIGGVRYAYSVWVHNTNFNAYFEGGTTNNGRVLPIGIEETTEGNIVRMNLQLSPNVTRGICRATFNNLSQGLVNVQVFDAAGRLVENAYSGQLNAGMASIEIPTAKLTSGTYFVRLETVKATTTAKFVKI